ncbi:transposon-transfer assisting family protein [Proteiniclasticum sp. QWL-01]|uniref:transposon-transfer assisting family protein n=1 Tax=Proteiniclasticum sp. QWL-01 TaxID=3036945 RepID=UPI0024117DF3|nr:transposon-transfer assisting family protein [Proteiniclasticum sp. QWL-01]WFF73549.1 transposon-transfer assisting family protein [Proteiniclasticum sp. QWL-01]
MTAQFTVEETNLMSCFDTSNRKSLITSMESVPLSELGSDMEEVLYRTVEKLKKLSDTEFSELYIAPDSLMDD